MTLDHTADGCRCTIHEARRTAERARYRQHRRTRHRREYLIHTNLHRDIEYAIARGHPTSQIMKDEHCRYEAVHAVRAVLELINNHDDA